MLVNAKLLGAQCYAPLESQSSTKFKWRDHLERNIRIIAPVETPWGLTWEIKIHQGTGKTRAGIRYVKELTFQCIKPVNKATHVVERIQESANYAYGLNAKFFAAFSVNRQWLIYLIKEADDA